MLQDPGNLEGDLQAGAAAGYTLLWVLVWSTVMVSLTRTYCLCGLGYLLQCSSEFVGQHVLQ